jgi:cytochrome oxidase Cu insertion factor (SCO1/SenC/PrrC family)
MYVASAQPAGTEARRSALRARFEASGLKVGAAFPEIDVCDADGKPFNTRSLKGQYTVIVNGCLT